MQRPSHRYDPWEYDFDDQVRDGDPIVMTDDEFRRLPDYSCTIPSGVFDGKVWRRHEPYRGTVVHFPDGSPVLLAERWLRGRYVPSPRDPNKCAIEWRPIVAPWIVLAELARLLGEALGG